MAVLDCVPEAADNVGPGDALDGEVDLGLLDGLAEGAGELGVAVVTAREAYPSRASSTVSTSKTRLVAGVSIRT